MIIFLKIIGFDSTSKNIHL